MTNFDPIANATKLIQAGKTAEATALLVDFPGLEANAAAQQLLGIIAFQSQRWAEAATHFEQAAQELTEDGYLQNNLGQAWRQLGDLSRAQVAFETAAALQPEFADPFNYLGLLHRHQGVADQAEQSFKAALKRRPDYAEAHFNLGALYQDQHRLVEAQAHYEQALDTKPDYVQALNNLGTVRDDLGDHGAAEQLYRRGLEIVPNQPELYGSLGSCLRMQARYEAAREAYQQAVEIAPTDETLKWNLGFLQLALGDWTAGWQNYRYRQSVDRAVFPQPALPLPDDLTGQNISLAAEQGLGDEIFFLRFAAEVVRRGGEVSYQPDSKIKTLVERVAGVAIGAVETADFSLADLPYLLGSAAPLPSILIPPQPEKITAMQQRLAAVGPPPYIGVTYRAGGAGQDTLVKQAPLAGIGAALKDISATIIDVQRKPKPDEQVQLAKLLGRDIADFSDINEDLETALALMTVLDDYIGVSNTNMHLRAAAGKPARVLVTHPGEYRWLVAGERSPWFPEFELYRQQVNGRWHEAFVKLSSDIKTAYE